MTATATRATFAGHARPETFLYLGNATKAPNAEGVLARAIVSSGWIQIVRADNGEQLGAGGTAHKFWAAPAPVVEEDELVEEETPEEHVARLERALGPESTKAAEAPVSDLPEIVEAKVFGTREEWLVEAIRLLTPLFAAVEDAPAMPPVRISVGWPGGRGKKGNVIGQAWAKSAASDGVAQVFVSPVLDDAVRVLDVVVHELVHVVDENLNGHRGRFAKIAKALGLEGKMTATVAGEELKGKLAEIHEALGEYPHAALAATAEGADGPKKQGTRMLKVECAEGSGYIVRMTRTWLDEVGTPICPCHKVAMEEAV